MTTREDVLKVLNKNPHHWCITEVAKARQYVEAYPKGTPLKKMAQGIPSQWAYYWGRDHGDRELMRNHVTESIWAFLWTSRIGDREMMFYRVTDPIWVSRWMQFIDGDGRPI